MSGTPGYGGSLEVTVMVPIIVKVRRAPKAGESILDVINKISQKTHRVNWRTIFEQLIAGQWDLKCNTCTWSLKSMFRGLQIQNKRKK